MWKITYNLLNGENLLVQTTDEAQITQLDALSSQPRDTMPLCVKMLMPDGSVDYISFALVGRIKVERLDGIVKPPPGLQVPRNG